MIDTLPDAPDATMINEAVQYINERIAAHVYRGSLEIGEYVLVKFFDDDIGFAGSRNGHKPVSYSRLCIHPDLTVSRSTLTNMVKTAAQKQFLVAGGIPEDQLGYSQKVFLARLENNGQKLALARACIDERLTARELEWRIQEMRLQSDNPSSSPVFVVEKYLTSVNRWIRKKMSAPEGMTSRAVIFGADPIEREKILDVAGGILEDMSVITNQIRELVTILNEKPAVPEICPACPRACGGMILPATRVASKT